jgi:serine/threonine-protein kinase RsbW
MHIDMAVCLPQEAETVSMVRAVAAGTLGLFGVEDECIEDIRLAISEACTNVIDHATSEDEYEVQIHVDDEHCSISVKNTGVGFDASSLAGMMPDPASARGRGVAIMRAVMDTVEFRSSPRSGSIVHLVRNLNIRGDGPASRLRSKRTSSWRDRRSRRP